jgi:hypothetical protein
VYGTPLNQGRAPSPLASSKETGTYPSSYSSKVRSPNQPRILCFSFWANGPKVPSFSQKSAEKGLDADTRPICLVERVDEKDDIEHLPLWKRRINRCTPLFSSVAISSYWLYLAFRIKYTIAAQEAANKIFVMAWTFIAVELGVARESEESLRQPQS